MTAESVIIMFNKDEIKFEKKQFCKMDFDYSNRCFCVDYQAKDGVVTINTDDEQGKTMLINWLNKHPECKVKWKTEMEYLNGYSEWTVVLLENGKDFVIHRYSDKED